MSRPVIFESTEWNRICLSSSYDKAKLSCTNAGAEVANHFADVSKMVKIGSGAERQIDDIMLTRYA